MPFFLGIPKKCLGIDVGTSAIKIVELSKIGARQKLENYGEISVFALYQKPFRTFEKSTLLLSTSEIARAIRSILEEAKIKEKKAVFSIPDFSSFYTTFRLPPMSPEELPRAVQFEARQHVPLPLSEVTLDWQVIEGKVSRERREELKILLVAVPNEVIWQYQQIAIQSNLKLLSLEAEVFGFLRSCLLPDQKLIAILVDIGAQSTTISVAEKEVMKISHSFDLAGNDLTQTLAKSFGIDFKEAEVLKKKYGILEQEVMGGRNVREVLLPMIDLISTEIKKISQNFYQSEGKEVQKIILAGGSAWLPGLKDYFQNQLQKEVEIANPFLSLYFPPILEKTLKKIGPSFAIAVGMAQRGIE